MERHNPFADYGTPLSGERFIGRDEEIRQVQNRLFGEGGYGSLAVLGMPRIGKTSLLLEAVRRVESKLKEIRAVVVRLNVGSCKSVDNLFHDMIANLLEGIRDAGWSNDSIESQATSVLAKTELEFSQVRKVFEQIRKAQIRAVCILDEFDAGRRIFSDASHCFHWLRELCSTSDIKAAFVLISKRRLQDVSRIAGYESNYWANVLSSITLRPFTEKEKEEFHNRTAALGITSPPEILTEISTKCGGHPYLLDTYAYYAWQEISTGRSLEVNWFHTTIHPLVQDYYRDIIPILQDAGMLDKFVQIFLGPQWRITKHDIDGMINYGIIQATDEGRLQSFLDGFNDFVRYVEGSDEMWPLWRDTERALRDGLETCLEQLYGKDWQGKYKKAYPNLCSLIDRLQDMMEKEQERFGSRAASSLLAYTYPKDLYAIMSANWPALGKPLLGGDKTGWSKDFDVLAKVRTPLAHNREEAVDEAQRLKAEGICKDILARIKSFEANGEG